MSAVNFNQLTYIGKTEYKNVYKMKCKKTSIPVYIGRIVINKKQKRKTFYEIREAALFIDKTLLSFGKEPVNILKKKV